MKKIALLILLALLGCKKKKQAPEPEPVKTERKVSITTSLSMGTARLFVNWKHRVNFDTLNANLPFEKSLSSGVSTIEKMVPLAEDSITYMIVASNSLAVIGCTLTADGNVIAISESTGSRSDRRAYP